MKLIKPTVMFSVVDTFEVLVDVARFENVKTKFITFGKYPGGK